MILRRVALVPVFSLLAFGAGAESAFQACNKRFLDAMDCFTEACGSQSVLDLPPQQLCEPRPCQEFFESDSVTSGLEYSWCVDDHKAAGGAVDAVGRPVPKCQPNPAYGPANAKAEAWIACQKREWLRCDGSFLDTYKVGGGLDLMACKADMESGKLKPR